MRKARLIGLLLAGALAALIAVLALSHDNEPVYRGKSLSYWLTVYEKGSAQSSIPQADAIQAVRYIGTNAIPLIIRWTRQDRHPWKDYLRSAFQKLPALISDSPTISSWLEDHPEFPLVWFEILRHDAAPAIPELVRVLNDRGSSKRSREVAMNALTFIGPEAVPILMDVIADGTRSDRDLALFYLAGMRGVGGHQFGTAQVLIQCLQDTNINVAAGAADALATCQIEARFAVPALTNALHDPRLRVRAVAANSLGRFAQEASSAVPDLRAALNDGDYSVRQAATNALRRIGAEGFNAEAQREQRGAEK